MLRTASVIRWPTPRIGGRYETPSLAVCMTTADAGYTLRVRAMFRAVRSLLELIRFSHTLFALPFALTSAALAWKKAGFQWQQLVGVLLCMVFARSAAMAFNRLADRRIDARNPRTSGRHLPTGKLTPLAVWLFTLACAAGFILSTLLFLPNRWPLYLSAPLLAFVCGYSY